MEYKAGVYEIKNTITYQAYIGKTEDLDKRKFEHFNNINSNDVLQIDMCDYNKENFTFSIIERFNDKKKLVECYQRNLNFYSFAKHLYPSIKPAIPLDGI